MIPTLIGVTLLVFAVMQFFSPVQRASLYVTSLKQIRDIQSIIEKYHLDDPFYVQYASWIRAVLSGNLGWSRSVGMPVSKVLLQRAPATFELVMFAIPLTVFLGVRLGVTSAVHRDKPVDHATRILAIIGWSLPSFWLGIVLLSIFYAGLGWFPPERLGTAANIFVRSSEFTRYTGINTIDALLNGQLWIFVDALRHLVLPVVTLITIQIALIVRVMRSSMLEALGKGYIITARAKGLNQKEVINKHARRNALIPIITLSGILTAGMLTGVIITETVFSYKGLGYYAAHAATQLDMAGILGFALLAGAIFVVTNLIVDVLYAYVDPRIRLG